MTTNVKVFKSTDTGAPALTGQAGSLLALLDAVLLNGYNSGAITITRGGATATANRTGHGFQNGDCILHAGADQPEYNGEFYIFNVTADTYDFTVSGSPATPATGTITAKRAPAGWTKPFSGANKAAYRQGGGNQRYLRVVDDGTGSATYARVVGYEGMSDVDTGTAAFPTDTQFSGGLYWSKSNAADATTRPWVILATDKALYLLINANNASTGLSSFGGAFVDFLSYKPGDTYNTLIIGGLSTATTNNNTLYQGTSIPYVVSGHYVARSYTQLGGSIGIGKHSDIVKGATSIGAGSLTYPNPVDGGLYLAPVYLHEPYTVRGALPGVWSPLHLKPLNHLDTFSGGGALAGRSFLAFNMYSNAQVFLEISNTWDQ
jgi:hypothetical protein